jgi:hypothetical protein
MVDTSLLLMISLIIVYMLAVYYCTPGKRRGRGELQNARIYDTDQKEEVGKYVKRVSVYLGEVSCHR